MKEEDRGIIPPHVIEVTVASATASCDVSAGDKYELPNGTKYQFIIVGQASKPQYRYLVNLVGLDTCVRSLLIDRDNLAAAIIATWKTEHAIVKTSAEMQHRHHVLDREIASARQNARQR